MIKSKKHKTLSGSQEAADQLVVSQSEDDSAWETPVRVKRPKLASLSIPGDLAARAAVLAGLHREARLDKWVERIVRERVELEEYAFSEAKKDFAS